MSLIKKKDTPTGQSRQRESDKERIMCFTCRETKAKTASEVTRKKNETKMENKEKLKAGGMLWAISTYKMKK